MKVSPFAATLMTVLLSVTGCSRSQKFDQTYYEYFFASTMAQSLELASRMAGKDLVLTNLLVLTNYVRIEVLADIENKFLQYGDEAGFTNSLLDRYVLLPQGVKGPPPDDGDILLVGAKPLRKESGKMERIFVAKYTKLANSFGADWIEEESFQQSLRTAGIRQSELSPPPMPSMRHLYDPKGEILATQRLLSRKLEESVEEYEREHSIPFWRRLYWQVAGLLVAVALILLGHGIVGRRRGTRR
jgi:hypothetical protein